MNGQDSTKFKTIHNEKDIPKLQTEQQLEYLTSCIATIDIVSLFFTIPLKTNHKDIILVRNLSSRPKEFQQIAVLSVDVTANLHNDSSKHEHYTLTGLLTG